MCMDEAAAARWMQATFDVSRETEERLLAYTKMLRAETAHNLIGAATRDVLMSRHIADSAQILTHCSGCESWLDLGSGAGLPGIVLAILTGKPTVLVEARTLRADWLRRVVAVLGLSQVVVEHARIESVATAPFAAITARAFAPLHRLLPLAYRFSTPTTAWVLPKGRSAAKELASVRDAWQGVFTLVPSVTDPFSAIILARDVRPRPRGIER